MHENVTFQLTEVAFLDSIDAHIPQDLLDLRHDVGRRFGRDGVLVERALMDSKSVLWKRRGHWRRRNSRRTCEKRCRDRRRHGRHARGHGRG